MKKVLYIALAVQSVMLLGVIGALLYSGLSSPRAVVENGAPTVADADGSAELAPLEAKKALKEEQEEPSHAPPSTDASASELTGRDGGPSGDEPAGAKRPEEKMGGVRSDLVAGNERFARGETRTRDVLAVRGAPGQPRAVVLGCSDAVVPVEQVFDQPLGSLVVVRSPAHFVDVGARAAVEDALVRQHVRVVIVLGHRGCPTVAAALREPSQSEPALATKLRPALALQRRRGEEVEGKAVEDNVTWAVSQLVSHSKALRELHLTVMRAVYDEATGEVRWLDVEPGSGKSEERRAPDTHR